MYGRTLWKGCGPLRGPHPSPDRVGAHLPPKGEGTTPLPLWVDWGRYCTRFGGGHRNRVAAPSGAGTLLPHPNPSLVGWGTDQGAASRKNRGILRTPPTGELGGGECRGIQASVRVARGPVCQRQTGPREAAFNQSNTFTYPSQPASGKEGLSLLRRGRARVKALAQGPSL